MITSGYEAAFFSQSREEHEQLRKPELTYHQQTLLLFLRNPQRFLASILILNNLFNIGLVLVTSATFQVFQRYVYLPEWAWVLLDVLVVTSILLLFCEITPKTYASQQHQLFLRRFSWFIRFWFLLVYPLASLLALATRVFEHKKAVRKVQEEVSLQELRKAIDLTSDLDSPPEEKQILKGLVNLNTTPVKAIMRARVDIKGVSDSFSLEEVIERVNRYGYSRMPVYGGSLDDIRGVLHIKDLLPFLDPPQDAPPRDWKTVVRKPYFVPEHKKLNKLLEELKARKQHFALVVDEYGGTSGLVTLEDILEEIFGEIADDRQHEELRFSQLSANEYVFDGKMPLLDICRVANLDTHSFDAIRGDNDSLGGLILEILGRFPQKHEAIEHPPFRFEVEAVTRKVIKRVKLTILDRP
jgi:gliding motility-associated protein GldE